MKPIFNDNIQYVPAKTQRRKDVVWCKIMASTDINMTSFWCCVPDETTNDVSTTILRGF